MTYLCVDVSFSCVSFKLGLIQVCVIVYHSYVLNMFVYHSCVCGWVSFTCIMLSVRVSVSYHSYGECVRVRWSALGIELG